MEQASDLSFGIKKIVECKIGNDGKQLYRVKWQETWESAESLAGCEHLITQYWTMLNRVQTHQNEAMRQHADIKTYSLDEDNKSEIQKLIARASSTHPGGAPSLVSPSVMLNASQQNNRFTEKQFGSSPQQIKKSSIKSESDGMGKACDTSNNKTGTSFVLDGWENPYAEVTFQCKVCKKSLPGDKKSQWKDHFKTHSDTFEFTCEFCQKGFHKSFNYKRHLKVHSKDQFDPTSELISNTFKLEEDLNFEYNFP